MQQFRNDLPLDAACRFVVHDRDPISATAVDDAFKSMWLQVLRAPPRPSPANAYCERFIGIGGRERLEWIIR